VSENALPRHFVPAAVTRSDSWNRVRRDAFSLNISSRLSVEDVSRRISRQLRALGASEVVELSPVPCGSAEAVDAVQNIVGIVKGAGRMANQEAVVVAAPVRVSEWDETSLDVESHPVVALFHLVATVETAPWLSKDVLFIISVSRSGCGCLNHVGVPCDDVGLRSWASVYLDGKGKQVGPQFGLLRGAVVLDWNPRDVTKNSNIALHIPVRTMNEYRDCTGSLPLPSQDAEPTLFSFSNRVIGADFLTWTLSLLSREAASFPFLRHPGPLARFQTATHHEFEDLRLS
jgi:hypothetical protein